MTWITGGVEFFGAALALMPYQDSLTPRDLIEKLAVLRVECQKCGRAGRYRVTTLAKQIGWDGKLTDWLYDLTQDCMAPTVPNGARRPDRRLDL